jgi:hypothetical protein
MQGRSRLPGAPEQVKMSPMPTPAAPATEPSGVTAGHAAQAALRWVMPIAALAAIGPLAAGPARGLRDAHGGDAVSLLLNPSPLAGIIAAVVLLALAVLGAGIGARLVAPAMGRTVAGLTIAWAAAFLGDTGDILVIAGPGPGSALALTLETLLLAAGGLAILLLCEHLGRRAEDAPEPPKPAELLRCLTQPAGLIAVVAAAVGALVGTWLVARDDMRGQAFMAAVLGAILAGAAARLGVGLTGTHHGPATGILLPAAGVLLAGLIAPFTVAVTPGFPEVEPAVLAHTFGGPGAVAPVDWLAGAILGTSIGVNWAASTLDRGHTDAAPAKPARRR